MTVLRPSLPPLISMTTRILSLPASAARAVLARKPGTTEPSANSDEPCSVRITNWRRVSMALSGLGQLVFGHGHDRMGRLTNAVVEFLFVRLPALYERDEFFLCFRADFALQE